MLPDFCFEKLRRPQDHPRQTLKNKWCDIHKNQPNRSVRLTERAEHSESVTGCRFSRQASGRDCTGEIRKQIYRQTGVVTERTTRSLERCKQTRWHTDRQTYQRKKDKTDRKTDTSRHLQDRQTYKQNERQREIQSDEKTDTTDRRDDQMDA